jgi:hypothetical protein
VADRPVNTRDRASGFAWTRCPDISTASRWVRAGPDRADAMAGESTRVRSRRAAAGTKRNLCPARRDRLRDRAVIGYLTRGARPPPSGGRAPGASPSSRREAGDARGAHVCFPRAPHCSRRYGSSSALSAPGWLCSSVSGSAGALGEEIIQTAVHSEGKMRARHRTASTKAGASTIHGAGRFSAEEAPAECLVPAGETTDSALDAPSRHHVARASPSR